MAVLLFHMRGVPDDEAGEVRALLTSNGIDYYETSAGTWGLATPAIWLRDDAQLERARSLIDAYQAERSRTQRERSAYLRRTGQHDTVVGMIKRHPLRAAACLAAIAVVLYLSLWPFLSLGGR